MKVMTDRNRGEAQPGPGAGDLQPLRAAFSGTLGLGASLLFLVQPMIAKSILPLLGGSPATWVTCMVFFQAVVLAGYLYAHAAARVLGGRGGPAVHVALVALAALALPMLDLPGRIGRGDAGAVASWVGLGAPPRTSNPVGWLLGLLAVSVGLPALAVATTSPLLQKWFAGTADPRAGDPYFLYAASNLGSLAALVGYPTVVEPYLRLANQGWLWAAGYVLLMVGIAACASLVGRSRPSPVGPEARGSRPAPPHGAEGRPTVLRQLRWVALAMVPSGLLLGVTSYLSSDIAAVPMLWVVPLALYLLTLVAAFSRIRLVPERLLIRGLPLLILAQAYSLLFGAEHQPIWLLVLLHVSGFFAAAMICHAELARDRPPPQYLTGFYLWMSLGGVLGGLFNALAAPRIFDTVAEYPLETCLACLLGPRLAPKPGAARRASARGWEFALPVILGLLAVVLLFLVVEAGTGRGRLGAGLGLVLGLACYAAAIALTDRPLLFGLSVGAFLLLSTVGTDVQGRLLYRGRSFFGVLRVAIDPTGRYMQLFHGRTIHGKQRITQDPRLRQVPLTYYHPDGPIGQVFRTVPLPSAHPGVAVVGLGAGSLASYGKPGQTMDFFEIDPGVEWVARDSGYFTFLRDSTATIGIILGDARLSLANVPDAGYGLIVLDAFSSDAIPVHLITREALRDVYLRKLAPGGLLAFHISNRYIDLRPVLAGLARDASLACRVRVDPTADDTTGKSASTWVVMARDPGALGVLTGDPRWVEPAARPGMPVWTDDYSDVLSVIR
jgi:hypothetical protein